MNTTGYLGAFPDSRPRIFAHRGLVFQGSKQVVDENTLDSFELALEAGADYLETDLQLTRDGIPVLFHDSDLTRLVGSKTSIAALSLDEIKRIRLPLGGTIPTLHEALEKFPSSKFNLDFKSPTTECPGMSVIASLEAFDRVLVSSFSEASRLRALSHSPRKIASSAGSSKVLAGYALARLYQQNALARTIAEVDAFQIPTKKYGIDFTHPRFVEAILNQNKEIHYWTVNDPSEMQTLFALGAHGIVTDRTDLARKAFI
jgi:glycerophosphoryl diester phosphodiesterase